MSITHTGKTRARAILPQRKTFFLAFGLHLLKGTFSKSNWGSREVKVLSDDSELNSGNGIILYAVW